MGEERRTWTIGVTAGERSWYAVDAVGRHRFMLFHGDQMRGGGFAGIPMYGLIRAVQAWATDPQFKGFRYAACGHWHSMWSMPINNRTLWINGSTESDNTWAQEELKSRSDPGQWLLFAHPTVGVTSEHRVWLS